MTHALDMRLCTPALVGTYLVFFSEPSYRSSTPWYCLTRIHLVDYVTATGKGNNRRVTRLNATEMQTL